MNDYNKEWCGERHEKIEKEFVEVWKKIDKFDIRIWGILILQFGILISVITLIFKYVP